MSYLQKNNSHRGLGKNAGLFYVAMTFFVIIFLMNRFEPDLLRQPLLDIAKPFWLFKSWVENRSDELVSYFSSKSYLEDQDQYLSSEVNSQSAVIEDMKQIEVQNQNLLAALGRTSNKNLVLAYVLQGPGSSPYDTFIIDIGSQTKLIATSTNAHSIDPNTDTGQSAGHIQIGDNVFVDGVLPIGVVDVVYPTKSVVSLYSTPGQETDVIIHGESSLEKAIGRGGGNFEVNIPNSISVPIGTDVFIPGLSAEYLGSIGSESDDIAHATESLYFRYDFNLNDTRFVYVETN